MDISFELPDSSVIGKLIMKFDVLFSILDRVPIRSLLYILNSGEFNVLTI